MPKHGFDITFQCHFARNGLWNWGRETKSVAALLVFAIKTCNIAQLNSIIFHLKKTIPQN